MVRSDHDSAPSGSLSAATASQTPRDTVGYRSSGQSPGAPTLHLVGPGEVGRRFLQNLGGSPYRVVAVTDSSATVFARGGIDTGAVLAHKAQGKPLAAFAGAEAIATPLAIELVAAEVVVEATPSAAADAEAALQRVRAALRSGCRVALAGKNALAVAAPELLLDQNRGRVGIDAVLGGAGAQLVRELDELRARCAEVALVGNVTTTVIVQAIERGASVEDGIAHARALGLLEPDATLDLDGSDAATKLAAVTGAVFGERWLAPVDLRAIAREDVRAPDAALLRSRAASGATTRLVARGTRDGVRSVAFEEVAKGSPLAAPPDRVVYTYALPAGLRVHTGTAVGYDRTAAALLADCTAFLPAIAAEVRS